MWFDQWWLLRRIARRQESIINNQYVIYREIVKMSKITAEVAVYAKRIDGVTSKLGEVLTAIDARIQRILDSADSGLTPGAKADLEDSIAPLDTVVASLDALSKDPANPVPVEPPPVPPEPPA